MKKTLSLLLVVVMVVSLFAGCGSGSTDEDETTTTASSSSTDETTAASDSEDDTTAAAATEDEDTFELVDTSGQLNDDGTVNTDTYDSVSQELYLAVLGDYYEAYQAASEATTVSERYALMAVAEAKLLESGVFFPGTANGGGYVMSRIAPYTSTPVLWGTDSDRYYQCLVTEELILTSDRDAMKEKWAELKGTGEYYEWAKSYLEEQGYTIKDTLTMAYTSDPVTWDIFNSSSSVDAEVLVNTYDGLVEYDVEGIMQPALAESWEVSDDGLTYTFHIREGATWVDYQGNYIADVTADDFVAGFQHMLDAQGGLEYLVEGIVVNATEYIYGTVTDFSEVGVEATDDYTLVYTLEDECSYFLTMLTYGVFAPLCRTYYESLGGTFGEDYATGGAGNYGLSETSIAYYGAYLVSNSTATTQITFTANPSYWNADAVQNSTIVWLYNDGTDVQKTYDDLLAGTIDSAGLNSTTIPLAEAAGYFDTYVYTSTTGSTAYVGFVNINRLAYVNFNDGTSAASTKTDEQKEASVAALQNNHFRLAILYAIDRTTWNAQVYGDDLASNSLINSYTPGTFVYTEEEVTIDINGVATTFPANTAYGEIVQAQLDADGSTIIAWDPDADGGVGASTGYDGWYNPESAVAELEQAIEELAACGIEISEDNPIYIDLPTFSTYESYANRAQVMKQSIEDVLGGLVIVNLVECDQAGWYYAGYYGSYGYETNADIYDGSGWGPDYGDPSTYLDTMLPDYAGYMTKCLGIF